MIRPSLFKSLLNLNSYPELILSWTVNQSEELSSESMLWFNLPAESACHSAILPALLPVPLASNSNDDEFELLANTPSMFQFELVFEFSSFLLLSVSLILELFEDAT